LADVLHLSGPIAMVVAGLIIGNQGRSHAMSPTTIEHLDTFWELIDEILNAVLFVLIGLEVIVLTFTGQYVLAGLLLIPCVLVARAISVGIPIQLLRSQRALHPQATKILTWAGLRGGISVALALSIPTVALDGQPIPEREPILAVTYVIVVFSVLVQGLTIGPFVKHLIPPDESPAPPPELTAH
jgi:CPA1 family monovalent cation:H+ antiporter